MTPTLYGRVQTRVLVFGITGLIVALALTPLLPTGSPLPQSYRMTLTLLAAMIGVGVLWEALYHLLQQFRWEKDWPTLFGLVTIVNEGLLMWLLVDGSTLVLAARLRPEPHVFLIHFTLTWVACWLVVQGPLRVVLPRQRFHGGRIL